MIVSFGDAEATARDEPAFSNEAAFARWSATWCDRCRYDTRHQAEFDPDVRVHPDAPRGGCPLLLLAETQRTPAQWWEQPDGSPDRYHCVEYRPNDDSPGSGDPQPIPEPPDMDGLFPRPERRVRMFVQPHTKPSVATEITLTKVISAQGLSGCVIDGCGKPLVGRGMCRRHYVAWYRRTPKDQRGKAANLKRKTPAERFAEKVDRRGPDECWPWNGSTHSFGHGQFYVSPERGTVPAHTYAVELATGIPCPDGKEGCHHCDNPPCCNPTHVYYGTRKENVRDMWARGRAARGSAKSQAKLTEAIVFEIRKRFAAGETQPALAREFGVSGGYVSLIVNGKAWAHVGGPIRTHARLGRRYPRKAA